MTAVTGAPGDPVLQISNLTLDLSSEIPQPGILQDVNLTVRQGSVTALIGESGCGKTLTTLAVLGLLPTAIRARSGSIKFFDHELLNISDRRRRRAVAGRIGAVSQDAANGLNPTMRIGDQISEARRLHLHESRSAGWKHALELLERVHVTGGERRLRCYPHELSGGMQQRVMIAMAIACAPKLLIADEPTTALDVTVQAEVLDLLRELCDTMGMGVLLVTHDLGVVAELADDVVAMYAGHVIEYASSVDFLDQPRHPYTSGLLASVPQVQAKGRRLATLPGRVPTAGWFPSGCRFAERCPAYEAGTCDADTELLPAANHHWSRCTRVQTGAITADLWGVNR